MTKKKIEVKCLECQAPIIPDSNLKAGEVLTCPQCSSDLEVIKVEPVKLGLAPKAQEDWGQ